MSPEFKSCWLLALVALCGCAPAPTAPPSNFAGSASCRECHADAYNLWAKSNHGLAERRLDTNADVAAFVPGRIFHHGSQSTEVAFTNGNFQATTRGLTGRPERHGLERVVGNSPLREFLVSAPGGRWQTLEAAYDPRSNDWFNVFGGEDRQPGEWGHWTGRGMNWNSMCASCHNTRLQKNYDAAADSYHTTMLESSVACEQCHGPLGAHVSWERSAQHRGQPDPTFPKWSAQQLEDVCASCHARRGDLTGNFAPGESFFDHFELATVDHGDLFYADGQIRDEDYEFTAFLGSQMHAAGVTCLDCHPRSLHMPRPSGNDVCLRCHAGGFMHAPIIQPEQHSHHLAGGAGDQCVGCHMPVTVYMQRHARHDHGFTIPDPLLTKEWKIPNACNRCHADKDADWALASVQQWYGGRMDRPTRRRAEWVAKAKVGDESAREPLRRILTTETNAYWQAVAAGLLDQWVNDPQTAAALTDSLAHPHPLVRAAAVRALAPLVDQPTAGMAKKIRPLLADPARSVRLAAAWDLRAELDTNSNAGRELLHQLDFNADQPVGQMQLGAFHFARGDLAAALAHLQKAVDWDSHSAPLRHELAVVLSAASRPREAAQELETACQLAPNEAEYRFALGLAWHEAGDLSKAIEAFQQAVQLEPDYFEGWYNLALAQAAAGQLEPALESLNRSGALHPAEARVPYARATVLLRLGHDSEAKSALELALEQEPNFPAARQLLKRIAGQ